MNSPCVNCGADAKVCKECDWYNGVWIPKDQYKAKLKADMAAILRLYEQFDDTDLIEVKYVRQTIQQKINALKVDQEGKE